ncbi:HD family phosphohydrolase [Spirochaetia bacterium]|nr:HD family phosphohydrolase [Spirochaetia bacterium]
MPVKNDPENSKSKKMWAALLHVLNFPRLRPGPAAATLAVFVVSSIIIVGNMSSVDHAAGDVRDFEAGKVADRDVLAEDEVSFVDEEATRVRVEAQERLVPAVFRFSSSADEEIRSRWDRFSAFTGGLFDRGVSVDAFKLAVQAEYPTSFASGVLDVYFADPERARYGEYGSAVLENILGRGIFNPGAQGLEQYNPDMAELLSLAASRTERELVHYDGIITMENLGGAINGFVNAGTFPSSFARIAPALLSPFITVNVLFSPNDTRQRVTETRERVEPVVKYIEKGQRIIKKGFIITEDNMKELRALNIPLPGRDPRSVAALILTLLLVYGLLLFLCGNIVIGKTLSDAEIYLISALAAAYLIGAVFVKDLSLGAEPFPVSMMLPTALVVMLPAILIGPRLALVLAMVLPLGAFFSGSFDVSAYLFALVSAVVASYSLQGAEKRMDLLKAGLLIAGANCVAVIVILLQRSAAPGAYPGMLFWAAFNGLGCGMLVLGFLPPLEHALNAATTFRLIELSDLNSPILRRLFTAAPGTYSHSIMVANLAETACQDIGANPLLARVGAYYHDIGKMEQPDYFVENQTVYNKHDDMAPRLSATVIRSHVKLGMEKARSLALPQQVLDIIAEHHGNSVITWFYTKARKQEGQVNIEDFTYPGNPPRSRESAVVMLADTTEAAVRTLNKPTAPKMDKFIQELISAKVEHGQLAESELTFRDLETIRKAFVRVLAGYYHSRIEYPKLGKETLPSREAAPAKDAAAAKEEVPAGEAVAT